MKKMTKEDTTYLEFMYEDSQGDGRITNICLGQFLVDMNDYKQNKANQ